MRTRSIVALSIVTLGVCTGAQATQAVSASGRLSGVTQITFGCPGPVRAGDPCENWSVFPHARFQVRALDAGSVRTVTSDGRGRFTLPLAAGRYRLTPLRQPRTTGGAVVSITIHPAATTWARVRFQGFPKML